MALRDIHSDIKSDLSNNVPLQVYHLVKFEKPSQLDHEAVNPADYVYLTDAAHPVVYDSQTYHPGGLLKVGKVPEGTEAKATNLSLTLSATKLGKQSGVFSVTSALIAANTQGTLTVDLDLFKSGFYPGDVVSFTPTGSGSSFKARIDALYQNGTRIKITPTSTVPAITGVNYRVKFNSSEIDALVSGGISTDSSGNTVFSPVSFDNYINRSVTIYRVFSSSITGIQRGDPIVLFKGIIAKGTLNEKPGSGSTITWSLTSHWGDFVRVSGRLTSDESHRGLDGAGLSDINSALKEEYVNDYGFEHADSSLNVIANYTDIATKTKMVKRGGLAGLFGGKKPKEEKYEVTRELDLSIDLDARYLPLVYGVQKVDPIPVFADVQIITDTNANDNIAGGATNLFQAQALCEGPIGGVYDIYMNDKGLVCTDLADSDTRGASGSDTPCIGRMDRGDVLSGNNLFSSSLLDSGQANDFFNEEDLREDPNHSPIFSGIFGFNTGFQSKKTGSEGIQHRESFKFPEANNIQLTVHTGKEDQEVDQTLLSLASDGYFLVQQNYYKNDASQYWTGNHRLLDTAYVVSKDTISNEDGRAPELSFVVRGKFVNCYHYDGSYRISSGDVSNFELGDSVNITLADGTTSGGTATVIDKWSFLSMSKTTDYRIRFKFDTTATYNSIVRDGTVGKFTATKGSNSLVFISPEYSNNASYPAVPTTPLTFGDFFVKGTAFSNKTISLKRIVSTVTTSVPQHIATAGGFEQIIGDDIEIQTTIYNYEYNFSSLSSDIKNTLKTIKETNGYITLLATGVNNDEREFKLGLNSLDTSTMIYKSSSRNFSLELLMGISSSSTSDGETTQSITVDILNYSLLTQNTGDTANLSDVVGLNIEINRAETLKDTAVVTLPTTSSLVTFCSTNEILILNKELPQRFRSNSSTNATYTYGTRGTYLDVGIYSDSRVSINPALQLLDYLTSKRYGKGLDIVQDLDLDSFKEVARSCDTNSDVYLLFPENTSFTVGHTYKYPATGTLQWQGTVKSFGEVSTKDGTNYEQVLFEECIGKLGQKWFNWKQYTTGDIVWSKKGFWKEITATGTATTTEPTSSGGTSISLKNISANTTVSTNTSLYANLGNPFVTQIDGNNNVVSGYVLYDSDDVKYWKYLGWDSLDQRYVTRHQTNTTIDTSRPVFDNVNSMLRQFNGILRFANGKYYLDQKVGAKDISDFNFDETVTEDDIVGDIKISDKGISKTFNSVNAQIIDPSNKFETRPIAFYNSNYKKQDKGVPRQGSYEAPGISNYFNARLNIKQVLDESRAGLQISFTMAPRGYLLLAGNIIAINHDRFNWTKKLFRIESLNTRDDLLVDIVAKEHNDTAYIIGGSPSDIVASYNNSSGGGHSIVFKGPIAGSVEATISSTAEVGQTTVTWTNPSDYDNGTHIAELWAHEEAQFTSNTNTSASNIVPGRRYKITAVGDTNWNTVAGTTGITYTSGVIVTAKAAGTGTGTAKSNARVVKFGVGNSLIHNTGESSDTTYYYWVRFYVTYTKRGGSRAGLDTVYEPTTTSNGVEGRALNAIGPAGDAFKEVVLYQNSTNQPTAPSDSQGFSTSSGDAAAVGSWTVAPSDTSGSEITWKAVASLKQVNSEGAWAVDTSWSVSRWSGDKGDDGNKGTLGEKGITGTAGTAGAKGITGTAGDKGPKGIIGTLGAKGIAGTQGGQGTQGPQGTVGAKGITGTQGGQGTQGPVGTVGAKGITGTQGGQGTQGPQGTVGAKGLTGTAGNKGPVGPDGTVGAKGTAGTVGLKGNSGSPGADAPYVVIGFDSAVNTAAERIASIKSFSGLDTVLANSVYWDAVTGVPHQNQGSDSATPTLTALTGSSGIINMDSIKLESGNDRVELTSEGMEIYAGNVLRVKIGKL